MFDKKHIPKKYQIGNSLQESDYFEDFKHKYWFKVEGYFLNSRAGSNLEKTSPNPILSLLFLQ